MGHKGFRAKQLSTHYFERLEDDPEQMTDLPKAVRSELVADLLPTLLTPIVQRVADDGQTMKYAWRLHDGAIVESVLMRYPNRVTICISSQAGCGMNCPFCATGQAGPDPQHVGRRDRRAGRLGGPGAATGRARRRRRRGPRGAAARQQRRLHGHGRGAGQLQGVDRRDPSAHRPGPRWPRHLGPRHHDVDGRARARHRQADGRGHPGDARAVAARPRRRAAQRARADQHPVVRRRGARRGLPLLRGDRSARVDRVRPDPRHQRPGLARRPARREAEPAAAAGGCTSTRSRSTRRPGSKWTASRRGVEQNFVERLRAHGVPTTIRDTRGQDIDGACGQLAASTA